MFYEDFFVFVYFLVNIILFKKWLIFFNLIKERVSYFNTPLTCITSYLIRSIVSNAAGLFHLWACVSAEVMSPSSFVTAPL